MLSLSLARAIWPLQKWSRGSRPLPPPPEVVRFWRVCSFCFNLALLSVEQPRRTSPLHSPCQVGTRPDSLARAVPALRVVSNSRTAIFFRSFFRAHTHTQTQTLGGVFFVVWCALAPRIVCTRSRSVRNCRGARLVYTSKVYPNSQSPTTPPRWGSLERSRSWSLACGCTRGVNPKGYPLKRNSKISLTRTSTLR